jgi:hypothetical protein
MNCRTISIIAAGLGMYAIPAVPVWAQTAPGADPGKSDAPDQEKEASAEPAASKGEPAPQGEPAPRGEPAPQREPTPEPAKQKFLKEPQSTMFGNFKFTPLQFIEFDAFHDSTQSFQDGFGGNSSIARSIGSNGSQEGTYAGKNGRMNFTARNTQIGLQIEAPSLWGITALGHCRIDFNGQQPGTPQNGNSENAFQNSATARLFHCYGAFQSPYIDVLGGLTYSIFGNQPYFFPTSLSFLGIPAEVFTRTTQLRLSHQFATRHLDTLVQLAAARPPQRNAEIPDIQGAVRLMFNDWKGARTIGAVGTKIDAAAIGISGVIRQFKVQEMQTDPLLANKIRGTGYSVDAFLPIIPAQRLSEAGNSLTVTGSFTRGSGIGDMWFGLTGGVKPQVLPPPAGSTTSPQIDIDPGLALYDLDNNLRTVTWQSMNVGVQYYWPGYGNVWTYGNYNSISSPNLETIVGKARKVGEVSSIFTKERFISIGTFWAIVPNFQVAFEYANLHQWFLHDPGTPYDNGQETNHRFSLATYYVF